MKHYSFHTFSSLHFHTFSWRSTLTLPQILGFNFVYCQCLPEYNSKHWRYTKGGLCFFLDVTLSYDHCLNLLQSAEEFVIFLVFQHNGSPLTDTFLQTKYGLWRKALPRSWKNKVPLVVQWSRPFCFCCRGSPSGEGSIPGRGRSWSDSNNPPKW